MTETIEGVILAAGLSSRANAFKMELPLKGLPIILHTLHTMRNFCTHTYVVGGFEIQRIIQLTENYQNLSVVENKEYRSGMFSSVQTGVKYVKADWFFFTPGDYPMVTPIVYEQLLQACRHSPQSNVFIPVISQGPSPRKGHPILVSSRLKEDLLKEPRDSNLKRFINRHGFTPVPVEDPAILIDIDTPQDYQKASQ